MNWTNLLPRQITNDYQGHPIARWVFALLTLITLGRSLVHMFASDGGAQSIATIPLDTFSANAADTVVLMFALWGLSQLLIGLIYVIVLWRYQTLIPLMYLLMIVEYAMRILLGEMNPIETSSTAPGAIADYFIIPLAFVMLWLSLGKTPPTREAAANRV